MTSPASTPIWARASAIRPQSQSPQECPRAVALEPLDPRVVLAAHQDASSEPVRPPDVSTLDLQALLRLRHRLASGFVTSAHSAHIPAGFIGWEAGPGVQAIFDAARKSDEYQLHCGAEVDPGVVSHRLLLEADVLMLLDPKVGIAPDARKALTQIHDRLVKLRADPTPAFG